MSVGTKFYFRHFFKVVLVGSILNALKLAKPLLGKLVGGLFVSVANTLQNLTPIKDEEVIKQGFAICHAREQSALGAILRRV